MKTRLMAAACATALLISSGVSAQTAGPPMTYKGPAGSSVPAGVVQDGGLDILTGLQCLVGSSPTCQSLDGNSAAFQGEVSLTVGTPDTKARRSLKAICSAAGNVAVTYADASTGVWAVVVGTQTIPIAVTTVNSSGTTATCTYSNLR